MIKATIGINQDFKNSKQAAVKAAQEAKIKLANHKASIVFSFSSIRYNQKEVLKGINKVFPDTLIVGGSAAGEIISGLTTFDAVNVMAIASDQIKFSSGWSCGVSRDSFTASAMAAKKLIKNNNGKKPDLVISLFDGMTGNGAALVEGVKSVLGKKFPLIGGSLGDDYFFKKTFEFFKDKVLTDAVVLIGLAGKFSYGFGIRHGWEPVGLPMKVTKAKGVLLQKINNKPALKLYEDHFGKKAEDLIKEPLAKMAYTYPLGIAVAGNDELLIRDPVIANKKGEITMAAAIPKNSIIRLMIGDRERAIAAANKAANSAKKQLCKAKPEFILLFNCMARNKLLGMRAHEDNDTVQNVINNITPMLGFYTYGEHGPLLGKKNSPAYFHNETMTILVVGK